MASVLAQIIRDVKLSSHPVRRIQSSAGEEFQIYNNFSAAAEGLRQHFDKKLLSAIEVNDGLTPLLYAYCRNGYQFLTASTERIFPGEMIDELLNSMQAWAAETIGTHHVSTPQLRVFLDGCYRDLMRDNVEARLHWVLWLGRNRRQKVARIMLASADPAHDSDVSSVKVDPVATVEPEFNQLLVHSAAHAYGIEMLQSANDPMEAAVLIDGYFW